ncbi:hypothetical protein SAMN04487969_113149 [Paenibacillus algorifonticola]|uniref:Uncharacterized protein n=1 Tax=Paenibacillus algorifonticola TaxID=684063 RepID=A0A1I2FUB0_9BACL|nr:hypothetical protein [Paenibacillus algorifonticola]SFF09014.1 hypothetical protein SAMN04487969_113149 [Paenibacillus algorifonticola]
MIEILEKVALKEIEEQSFELTKQYLSVHKLVYENDKPKIADVIMNDGEQSAEFYFSIVDEDYYFVVYLDTSPEVKVRFMGMSAGNRVYLSVSSNVTNLEKLLEGVHLVPIKTWQKGTPISKINANRFYEDSGSTLLIWNAKMKDFDAGCYIDGELLIGAGLNETIHFLQKLNTTKTKEILEYIEQYETNDDYMTREKVIDFYSKYYRLT